VMMMMMTMMMMMMMMMMMIIIMIMIMIMIMMMMMMMTVMMHACNLSMKQYAHPPHLKGKQNAALRLPPPLPGLNKFDANCKKRGGGGLMLVNFCHAFVGAKINKRDNHTFIIIIIIITIIIIIIIIMPKHSLPATSDMSSTLQNI